MAKGDQLEQRLNDIYYNAGDPGGYGGEQRLLRRARELDVPGATLPSIRAYLRDQQTYSLHKPARKTFIRNKTITGAIDKQWQADLADMQTLAKSNSGYKYILTVIDIFSKFAWTIPVKSKSSGNMVEGFKALFKKSAPRVPQRLQTDAGARVPE